MFISWLVLFGCWLFGAGPIRGLLRMDRCFLRTGRVWLWAVPIALLPVFPTAFAIFVAFLGVFSLVKGNVGLPKTLLLALAVFAILGSSSQVFAPPHPLVQLMDTAPREIQKNKTASQDQNLFDWRRMIYLQGWNPTDNGGLRAKPLEDGFWRVPRLNPGTGNPYSEIFIEAFPRVQANQIYTQSFYFRHDGREISFQVSFFTQRGHHPVPVTIEEVVPGLWRAYATFRSGENDKWVRPLNLVALGGDWTYLDLGYVQLEVSSRPTPYIWPGLGDSLLQRIGWWVGVALLGLFTALGSQFLLRRATPTGSAAALLVGMFIHICVALFQYLDTAQRVSGLTLQPNLLGHSGVVIAAVIIALWPKPVSGMAVIGSLVLVILSGSRTALLAWVLITIFWLVSNLTRRSWRWLLPVGLVIGVAVLGLHLVSNRLSNMGVLDGSMLQVRYEIWEVACKAFLSTPITGIGHDRFSTYYILNHPEGVIEPLVGHAHNLVAHILSEAGLLGLMGFAVLYGYALIVLALKRVWGGLLVLAVAMLLNLGDYSFFNDFVYYPVWFALGWALIHPRHTIYSARMPQ